MTALGPIALDGEEVPAPANGDDWRIEWHPPPSAPPGPWRPQHEIPFRRTIPASDLAGVMGAGGASSSASSAAGVGSQSVSSGSGESGAVAAALMKSATPVHGAWGSGRLLRTSLVSVLITNSGHVLVGAVTPAVLYAAAAQVK